jgi:hypothetical protein
MSELAASKGSKIIKALGVITLVSVIIAVGRIVLKVFTEKEAGSEDNHAGV